MALSAERLDEIKKALLTSVEGDPEAVAEVNKSFAGLEAAVAGGEAITADDLSDIIGDVVVSKENQPAAPAPEPMDPLAPLFVELHKALVGDDGLVRKGIDRAAVEKAIQATYEKALGMLDQAIEGAVEATVDQIGDPSVAFGKAKEKQQHDEVGRDKAGDGDGDGDGEGDDDMDKMLKALQGAGVPASLIRKMADQHSRIEQLEAERDLAKFTKMAEEIGEGRNFATTLMKLHQDAPEAAAEIVKRLRTKNEALRKSAVWSGEIGGDGGEVTGSAIEQLNGHARELVQKGEKDARGRPMTFAKAFTEVCTRYPELYAQYQQENRR
ncbi:MAG: hypothetical protein KGL39_03245 [Patescibacteria group bacterium]|nr:hypothetical protein [Patescibacteria group bacterium]